MIWGGISQWAAKAPGGRNLARPAIVLSAFQSGSLRFPLQALCSHDGASNPLLDCVRPEFQRVLSPCRKRSPAKGVWEKVTESMVHLWGRWRRGFCGKFAEILRKFRRNLRKKNTFYRVRKGCGNSAESLRNVMEIC